jgi:hypothetical protein
MLLCGDVRIRNPTAHGSKIRAAPIKEEDTMRRYLVGVLICWLNLNILSAQANAEPNQPSSSCTIEATNYKGWSAEQLSNHWLQLIVVPQNGGRLMQVIFNGHSYLFSNPKYEGKYLPPDPSKWFNYGGDKLWLLPEGNDNEQEWVGNSDLIDDGPYTFRKVSEGQECEIELTGPADPQTGIQIRRTIQLDGDSSRIRFHATMQNKSGHVIEWSIQSVSQYDTLDRSATSPRANQNFWTFTPANPSSSYLNRYHVRFGPAENPAVAVRDDGLFALHYAHLAAELWLDSTPGWLAVVDGDSKYAMVERFRYEKNETYPGKASVIFWMNGPETRLSSLGEPSMTSGGDGSPYYLEAELNSPLVQLRPGETKDFDTEWFPTRAGSEFHGVADAGTVVHPLQATSLANGHIHLSGSFGVFFSGRLITHLYDDHGGSVGTIPLTQVDPTELVVLDTELTPPAKSFRISLHLEDANGLDRGSLQEVKIEVVPIGRP